MYSASLTIFIVIVATILFATTTTAAFNWIQPSEINIDAYCGPEPYPARLPPIPMLPNMGALELTLARADVFFRHGDRSVIVKECFSKLQSPRAWTESPAPVKHFHSGLAERITKTNPVEHETYAFPLHPLANKQILDGDMHYGQLTQKGVMQALNNGMRLGRYFNQTFASTGHKFSLKTISARTTDTHRTKETLQGVFTGIIDAAMIPTMGKDFTPPVNMPTIGFVDSATDAILSENCNLDPYYKKVYADDEWKEFSQTVHSVVEQKVRDIVQEPNGDLYENFDCLKTQFCWGKEYPKALDTIHADMESAILNYWVYAFAWNQTEANQLFTGPLVLFELLPAFMSGYETRSTTTTPHVHLWSVHDLGSMMNMLGMFQIHGEGRLWPSYQSMFQIEMYNQKTTKMSYMRFLLNGKPVIPAICKDQVYNAELCPTEVVIAYLQTAIPTAEQCPKMPFSRVENIVQQIKQITKNNEFANGIIQQIENVARELKQQQQQSVQNTLSSEQPINNAAAEFLRFTQLSQN